MQQPAVIEAPEHALAARAMGEACYRIFVDRVSNLALFIGGCAPVVGANEQANAIDGKGNLQDYRESSQHPEATQHSATLTGARLSVD